MRLHGGILIKGTIMEFSIKLLPANITVQAQEGEFLLAVIRRAHMDFDAPCGGNHSCKKCGVLIRRKGETTSTECLACETTVDAPLEITLPRQRSDSICTAGLSDLPEGQSSIRRIALELLPMRQGMKESVWDIISCAINIPLVPPGRTLLQEVSRQLISKSDTPSAIIMSGHLLGIIPEEAPVYAAAFDVGTTTLAAYLLEPEVGEVRAVSSRKNPQSRYGADVISRAEYAMAGGDAELRACLLTAMREMIAEMCEKAAVNPVNVFLVCVVGNSCMQHLLLGISPETLVKAPYIPAISQCLWSDADNLGIAPDAQMVTLPNLAGFVGSDTIGCLLAAKYEHWNKPTLLTDIGTNGEMVLSDGKRGVACSTAAGPAFEGAKIHCGMRGAEGAIDHVGLESDKLTFSVIGGGEPVGICGSGLIDLVAVLLDAGFVDESGRMTGEGILSDHRRQFDGKAAFSLTDTVLLTQQDIREVQLAKAAIAAGIRLLEEELCLPVDQIETVLIAGAFGTFMDPISACRIGLLPEELLSKVRPIGNASGEGAKAAIFSEEKFAQESKLAEELLYIELANSPMFQDVFVDELEFLGGGANW